MAGLVFKNKNNHGQQIALVGSNEKFTIPPRTAAYCKDAKISDLASYRSSYTKLGIIVTTYTGNEKVPVLNRDIAEADLRRLNKKKKANAPTATKPVVTDDAPGSTESGDAPEFDGETPGPDKPPVQTSKTSGGAAKVPPKKKAPPTKK